MAASLQPLGMEIDPHARLFAGDATLLRAVRPEYAERYRQLLREPYLQRLMAEGHLIHTAESDATVPGYGVVLEHPRIEPVSYPFEWTASMFKAACELILSLNIELMRHGYCLQDAHPWNVLFDGTRPVFVDYTSIVPLPADGRWIARGEFDAYCVGTLTLMSRGLHGTARALLRNVFESPDPSLVRSLAHLAPPLRRPSRLRARRYLHQLVYSAKDVARSVGGKTSRAIARARYGSLAEQPVLLERIRAINVAPAPGEWSTYYDGHNVLPRYSGAREELDRLTRASVKHEMVERVLERVAPRSVLDIGCNRGLYSQIAAWRGARAVGIDLDEYSLDRMYDDSCRAGSNALPLYVNAVAPAQAQGFRERPFPDVADRLRSDFVLCLALVHHLVYKRTQMKFDHIASVLSAYTGRTLLVEFVPSDDPHVSGWHTPAYDWYTCDQFARALGQHFSSIEVTESFPAPRRLLLCGR